MALATEIRCFQVLRELGGTLRDLIDEISSESAHYRAELESLQNSNARDLESLECFVRTELTRRRFLQRALARLNTDRLELLNLLEKR